MNDFDDAIRLIKTKSTAIRSESDLNLITTTFDADLSNADAVWASLSKKQKNVLCKHFEFRAALTDDGDLYSCVEQTGVDRFKYNPAGIFVLIRGEAIVSVGEHSVVVRGGDGVCVERAILGRLAYPEDAYECFEMESTGSIYHRFVELEKRVKNVNLHFQKGSSYVYLPGAKSDVLIERLNASLVSKAVLRDIGLSELLQPSSDDNKPSVCRFKAGDVLVKQGTFASRVLLLAKGSCFVFRTSAKRRTSMCVGSLASPSFVFAPLVLDSTNDDCLHPMSVVAVSEGYAYSFCSKQFLFAIKHADTTIDLLEAFRLLARSQDVWTESAEEDCIEYSDAEELIQIEEEEREETANVKPEKEEIEDSHQVDIDSLIANIDSGTLKRKKLLKTLHTSIAADEDAPAVDHNPLLQTISKNLLKEIKANLERDCGVTFGSNGCAFTAMSTDDPDEHMILLLPPPNGNRLAHMADNFLGLGRKRSETYDDSDPFLKPVPSAMDRKMHGKTLPIIRRVKGSIDTANYIK